jgi:predicted SAM-dependent methyltransferase
LPIIGSVIGRHYNFPKWPENTSYGNILNDNLVPAGSCSLIYASHVLEHLSHDDALAALRNLNRFIKPNGIVRVIIPDIEKCVRKYLALLESGSDHLAADNLMKDLGMGLLRSRQSLPNRLKDALGNSRHQWMYDKYSLQAMLEEGGFSGATLSQYGGWSDTRFSEVEKEEQCIDALCVEARKPFE